MDNIVVFGSSGQLGQCFKRISENEGIKLIHFPSEAEANILDVESLRKIFEKYKPVYCINCAAYTAVDKAEDEREIAFKVNKTGVENLSILSLQYDSTLFHMSTDFVFKGDISTPRSEDSETFPVNIYGQSKLDGEKVVESLLKKYFIIRTGWLYSEYGSNFVKTMLRLAAEKSELSIVADQVGTPTYAIDLATCILRIINSKSEAYGIYHYSNEGVASWYDFAKSIFDISDTVIKALPIRTEEYKTKAARPAYSVMDKSKIKGTFQIEIPYWRDSLIQCINRLKELNN
ncbi:MAG TPA: dTDP-4-dehydrorhamnose reductase [Mucilaginibacter sp.]|jgi:dTDP-4-dehydrorhamnose reductase